MPIQEIRPAYETTDGMLFRDKGMAEEHQAKIDFVEWYEENRLLGSVAGSHVEVGDLFDWLIEHKKVLLPVMEAFHG